MRIVKTAHDLQENNMMISVFKPPLYKISTLLRITALTRLLIDFNDPTSTKKLLEMFKIFGTINIKTGVEFLEVYLRVFRIVGERQAQNFTWSNSHQL